MSAPIDNLYNEAKEGTATIKSMLKKMVETVEEVESTQLCKTTSETITDLMLNCLEETFAGCTFSDKVSTAKETSNVVKKHMRSKVRSIIAMWLYVNVDPTKAYKKFQNPSPN